MAMAVIRPSRVIPVRWRMRAGWRLVVARMSSTRSYTIFTGRRAAELGLVDRLGDLRGAMRERFGDTVRLRAVEPPRTRRWTVLPGFARSRPGLGDLLEELWAAVEERLIWSRFGL